MAKKDTFDKMYELYNAIVDIDKIVNDSSEKDQNGDCKLERVLFYVKDIPKDQYPKEYSDKIINYIRSAIVSIYDQVKRELDNDISKAVEDKAEPTVVEKKIPISIPKQIPKSNTNLGSGVVIPSFLTQFNEQKPVQDSRQVMINKTMKNYPERGTVHAGETN